jgi:hypothetical protein
MADYGFRLTGLASLARCSAELLVLLKSEKCLILFFKDKRANRLNPDHESILGRLTTKPLGVRCILGIGSDKKRDRQMPVPFVKAK